MLRERPFRLYGPKKSGPGFSKLGWAKEYRRKIIVADLLLFMGEEEGIAGKKSGFLLPNRIVYACERKA